MVFRAMDPRVIGRRFADLNVQVQKSLPHSDQAPSSARFPGCWHSYHSTYSTVGDLRRLKTGCRDRGRSGSAGRCKPRCFAALSDSFRLIVQVRESENTARSRGALRPRGVRRFLLPMAGPGFRSLAAAGEKCVAVRRQRGSASPVVSERAPIPSYLEKIRGTPQRRRTFAALCRATHPPEGNHGLCSDSGGSRRGPRP